MRRRRSYANSVSVIIFGSILIFAALMIVDERQKDYTFANKKLPNWIETDAVFTDVSYVYEGTQEEREDDDDDGVTIHYSWWIRYDYDLTYDVNGEKITTYGVIDLKDSGNEVPDWARIPPYKSSDTIRIIYDPENPSEHRLGTREEIRSKLLAEDPGGREFAVALLVVGVAMVAGSLFYQYRKRQSAEEGQSAEEDQST